MNNIDILEEKENIKLEDKYKQSLKMAKEVMEDVCERNNGCEPSKSECLAYNMQYVKKYVETLIEENKELKERNKRQQENLKITNKKIAAQRGQLMMLNKAYIPKSKVEEVIEELEAMSISQEIYYEDILKILQSLLGKE